MLNKGLNGNPKHMAPFPSQNTNKGFCPFVDLRGSDKETMNKQAMSNVAFPERNK